MKNKEKKDILNLKRQWIRDNRIKLFGICISILGGYIIGGALDNYIIIGGTTILAFLLYIVLKNKMQIYIEENLFT